MNLSQERLKEVLSYSKETGIFTWAAGRNLGLEAGCTDTYNRYNYRVITIDGKHYRCHRLAWLYEYGEWPEHIDHINGDGSDNRIKNLRSTSPHGNMLNKRLYDKNTSGVPGVFFERDRGKWKAQIALNKRTHCLGRFDDVNDAIAARKNAEASVGVYHKNHGRKT